MGQISHDIVRMVLGMSVLCGVRRYATCMVYPIWVEGVGENMSYELHLL